MPRGRRGRRRRRQHVYHWTEVLAGLALLLFALLLAVVAHL
jgi:hypothetical protein